MAEDAAAEKTTDDPLGGVPEDAGGRGPRALPVGRLGGLVGRLGPFAVLPVLLLVSAVAGLSLAGLLGASPGGEEVRVETAEALPSPALLTYEVPELQVDLDGLDGASKQLTLSVALEVEDAAAIERLETAMPYVIDNFRVYLRELAAEDLSGPDGRGRLGDDLLLRINASIRPAQLVGLEVREMSLE